MSSRNPPSQFLLLSQPRTGCHLLERMLSRQSRVHTYLHHPFGTLPRYPRKWLIIEPFGPIPAALEEKNESVIEKGVADWRQQLETTQKAGKALFVHVHPLFTMQPDEIFRYISATPPADEPSNPTLIPDSLLLHHGTVPVFTIRNPYLQVSSMFRVVTGVFAGNTWANCLAGIAGRWTRLLYDWYVTRGVQPVVVDADDYMSSEAFVRYLARVTALDPQEVLTSWESGGGEESTWDSVQVSDPGTIVESVRALTDREKTLLSSHGPQARKAAKNVDLIEEEEKWDNEFGPESAEMLREIVKAVWEDYEYLRRRRLVLPAGKL